MAVLTIFTPAYNRAHTLGRTYASLCRQTCLEFEWLVVDDGSTDGTRAMVEGWMGEAPFPIRYVYQENQGMHGAHNAAYRNIDTELNTCIDSDDWMPDDAVETILRFWREKGSDRYAGFVGLDCTADGKVIGKTFPEGMTETSLDGYYEAGGSGDKKVVYRTAVVRSYPEYPTFPGEKYISLSYLYNQIDMDWKLLTINKPLVVVEYQPDGSSMNMYRQYWNNPRGWRCFRKLQMHTNDRLVKRIKTHIFYVSHSLRAGAGTGLAESPQKLMTLLCIPAGAAFYLYVKHKVKGGGGKR